MPNHKYSKKWKKEPSSREHSNITDPNYTQFAQAEADYVDYANLCIEFKTIVCIPVTTEVDGFKEALCMDMEGKQIPLAKDMSVLCVLKREEGCKTPEECRTNCKQTWTTLGFL